jgi:hypothetical protein
MNIIIYSCDDIYNKEVASVGLLQMQNYEPYVNDISYWGPKFVKQIEVYFVSTKYAFYFA